MKIGILGTGSYVPEKILTNDDLEKIVDTNDEWIRTRTGIEERRIAASNEATSDLSYKAAERAIENAKVNKNEIELVILATMTPDHAAASHPACPAPTTITSYSFESYVLTIFILLS